MRRNNLPVIRTSRYGVLIADPCSSVCFDISLRRAGEFLKGIDMAVKILTLQGEKNKRIAKRIKRLREDWKKKVRGHQNSRLGKVKFDYYKEGLIDSLGLKKTSELIKLSNFYFT